MSIIQSLNSFLSLFIKHSPEAFVFIGFIWVVHIVNSVLKGMLNIFGIIPRQPFSLIFGPIASPYLHGDSSHISYNSLPLFVMTTTLFAHGVSKALAIILAISYLEGIMVWCFARTGNHIGASGLIMGLFSYFLYAGYQAPSAESIIIALVLLYYFGTLLLSIFPEDTLTSYEGHLAGFISGFIVAYFKYPASLLIITQPLAKALSHTAYLIFG